MDTISFQPRLRKINEALITAEQEMRLSDNNDWLAEYRIENYRTKTEKVKSQLEKISISAGRNIELLKSDINDSLRDLERELGDYINKLIQ